MRAWLLDSLGGVKNLRLADVPDPVAADGEAVVELDYAALNPADRYLSEGQYPARPAMPHVLGRDGVGTVVAVAAGVAAPSVGDRVIVLRGEAGVTRPGTFAQRVAVPAHALRPAPEDWSDPEAAAAALVYLTAYQALTMWEDLPPTQAIVLITGASGGVGVATTQLACAMGHTVLALSRSPEKSARLAALGAAATFDPNDTQLRRRVKEFLGPRRVDLAVDNVGGALLNDVIDLLAARGRASLVGRLAGPVPNFNTASLFFRRLRLGGVAVGTYSAPESRAAFDEVLSLLAKTDARPLVDRVFNFEELPAAFERLAEGPMGKVVLKVKA